jgi:competence protein ComEC
VWLLAIVLVVAAVVGAGCLRLSDGSNGTPKTSQTQTTTSADNDGAGRTPPTDDSAGLPTNSEAAAPADDLTVVFLDVGQANAAYLECGGQAALIDGGNRGDSSLVYSFLRRRGVDYLRYVINTHPDEDHVGGLAGALQYAAQTDARVDACLCSTTEYGTKAWANFVSAADAAGVALTVPARGATFQLGDATIQVVGHMTTGTTEDDNGLVLLVTHGDNTFLFTGDISTAAEAPLVNDAALADIDVLSVAHHGSNTSTGYVFLRHTNPRYAVISCGRNNQYGHPTEAVLSRLRDQGATLYRCDLQGDVSFVSDGAELTATCDHAATGDLYAPGR